MDESRVKMLAAGDQVLAEMIEKSGGEIAVPKMVLAALIEYAKVGLPVCRRGDVRRTKKLSSFAPGDSP